MISYLILLFGCFLIAAEFFLPGGIVAAVGALVVFFSLVLVIARAENIFEILIFIIVMLAALTATIQGSLWWVRRSKKYNSIYLGSDQQGFRASSYPEEAIGQTVKAHTDLRPGGYILWKEGKIQAISLSGFVTKGDDVVVVRGEGETLFVTALKEGATAHKEV